MCRLPHNSRLTPAINGITSKPRRLNRPHSNVTTEPHYFSHSLTNAERNDYHNKLSLSTTSGKFHKACQQHHSSHVQTLRVPQDSYQCRPRQASHDPGAKEHHLHLRENRQRCKGEERWAAGMAMRFRKNPPNSPL